MLLSFFKPELADSPPATVLQTVSSVVEVFDPIAQASTLTYTWQSRSVANPSPSTEDLIAGAAAVFRDMARELVRRTGEPIEHLTIGVPSLSPTTTQYASAIRRREDALARARLKEDFGVPHMTITFVPEALAAAHGIDPAYYESASHLAVIDIGAGTSDFTLNSIERKSERAEVGDELAAGSSRFAGRDLNVSMANWLKRFNSSLGRAFRALDARAWQVMLDREMENAKRALAERQSHYVVRLRDIGSVAGPLLHQEDLALTLKSDVTCDLVECHDQLEELIRHDMIVSKFLSRLQDFLDTTSRCIGSVRGQTLPVVLVGGAFRFPPLRTLVQREVEQRLGERAEVRYQSSEQHLQTSVAVGLARKAALRALRV